MKTLKIKKRREKKWHKVSPNVEYSYPEYIECRDYIIQMTEEEYFEYIRLKGRYNLNGNE